MQALRWDPTNSQLQADLAEVQEGLQAPDAATLRQAADRRFKLKAGAAVGHLLPECLGSCVHSQIVKH